MEVEKTGESCFGETVEESQAGTPLPTKKCDSDAALPAATGGCFDCNICLDFAVEPVVTLCGHLYCWPCIYKWLQQQVESASPQQCPVCKAPLPQSSLVPLYGRGHHSTKGPHQSLQDIPRRPPSVRLESEQESPRVVNHDIDLRSPVHRRQQHFHFDHGYPYGDHISSPPASPWRTPTLHYTSGGVLGGMAVAVLPWVFRNQEGGSMSPYYQMVAGGGAVSPWPRVRRQEMQVERSLHQIWVFCCCCALLCLLLF